MKYIRVRLERSLENWSKICSYGQLSLLTLIHKIQSEEAAILLPYLYSSAISEVYDTSCNILRQEN